MTYNEFVMMCIQHSLSQECVISEQNRTISKLRGENAELRREVENLKDIIAASSPKEDVEYHGIDVRF